MSTPRQLTFFKLLGPKPRPFMGRVKTNYQKNIKSGVVFTKILDYNDKKPKSTTPFYPWHELRVGEGFLLKNYPKTAQQFRNVVDAIVNYHFKTYGVKKKFATRTTKTGIVCWRTL